jgi:O-antigen/teichoic acid export membrane protein
VGAYTITGALSKAIAFAALPFFINTLSEGDIGILTIFSNCIVFLTPIVSMGVLYTISVDYFKLSREKYAVVFSTGLVIPAVLCLLLLPILYIFRDTFEKSFHFQYAFFWLVPTCLFLNFCFEAFVILIRNQNKVKLFTIVSLLKVGVDISLSVLFVLFIYQTWYSRALAFLLAGLVVGVFFFAYIKRQKILVQRIDYKVLKNEIYFGLSGMVLQTAIFFINSSDKFFVMGFFGKEQAGYYAVASTFATIQYIICISLLQYLQPLLYRRFAESQRWHQVKDLYYKYILAMVATLVSVAVFTWFVYHYILKATYSEYLYYFYILAASSFTWTISNIFLQFIVFNKNKKIILQLSLLSILFSFLVNFFTAKYTSVTSLALGQIVTNLLVFVIIIYFNKKLKYFA